MWRIALSVGLLCLLGGAPAKAQPMQTLTIYVVKNLLASPNFMALENGYWAEQGLNVQMRLTSGGRQVVQALQAATRNWAMWRSAARFPSAGRAATG